MCVGRYRSILAMRVGIHILHRLHVHRKGFRPAASSGQNDQPVPVAPLEDNNCFGSDKAFVVASALRVPLIDVSLSLRIRGRILYRSCAFLEPTQMLASDYARLHAEPLHFHRR